jgi:putative hemolysin
MIIRRSSVPRIAHIALCAIAGLACVAQGARAQSPAPANKAGLANRANPASQNCVDKGGTLTLEKNGKGGQFGVCTFPDNLVCEEWAMVRGDCRTGGIKVTGFLTPAARYCAITGGTYAITGNGNAPDEQGRCSFTDGGSCDAAAYFDGACTRTSNAIASGRASANARSASTPKAIRAKYACDAGKTIDALYVNGAQSSVSLALSDGRKLSLPQAISASGARYATSDESIVFWNKGNTAFIEENGKLAYSGCAAAR